MKVIVVGGGKVGTALCRSLVPPFAGRWLKKSMM